MPRTDKIPLSVAAENQPSPADDTILPPPHSGAWEWQLDASCRGRSSETFFGEDEAQTDKHEIAAKKICSSCPVMFACREHAVRTRQPHGVWGGLSPRERRLIRWSYV